MTDSRLGGPCRECAAHWTRPAALAVASTSMAGGAPHTGHDGQSARAALPSVHSTLGTTGSLSRHRQHWEGQLGGFRFVHSSPAHWRRAAFGACSLAYDAKHTGHDRQAAQPTMLTVHRTLDTTDSRLGRLCRACAAHWTRPAALAVASTSMAGEAERRRVASVTGRRRGGEAERRRGGEAERRRGGEAQRRRGGEAERRRGGESLGTTGRRPKEAWPTAYRTLYTTGPWRLKQARPTAHGTLDTTDSRLGRLCRACAAH